MRLKIAAFVAFAALSAAPAAFADCVNFSPARAEAERQAAQRNPFTAADLGVPTLNGLQRDLETIGDPRCGGLTARGLRARFTITSSFRDIVAAYYPNIKRLTERDGQGREWFKNPMHGDDIYLTSGTRLTFISGRTVNGERTFTDVMIERTEPAGALTPETQPYTAEDIVFGSPWVNRVRGNFVRSDQGPVAPTPAAITPAPGGSQPSQQQASCPPASASNDQNARVGADIGGAVLGGGFGRNLGGALGGLLGGGQPKQQPQSTNPNCPR
jgi:hypothetical protein